MPRSIDHNEVLRLVEEQQAQLVEVLPGAAYEQEHLAGAVSLPLKELTRTSAEKLARDRPVIVYCHDFL